MRLVAYVRVSTDEQAASGHGIAAQQAAIQAAGHQIVAWIEETGSGRRHERPQLERAIGLVEAGEAEGVIVAKLDRLTRSVHHLHEILERADANSWGLVVLDLGIDTSTPNGKLVASIIGAIAEWEREIISQRTREGLHAAIARGAKPGRPIVVPERVARWARAQRAAGKQWQQIADDLNAQGVKRANGKPWTFSGAARLANRKPHPEQETATA